MEVLRKVMGAVFIWLLLFDETNVQQGNRKRQFFGDESANREDELPKFSTDILLSQV